MMQSPGAPLSCRCCLAGKHHVPRQAELHLVEALEAADADRVDHVPVPVVWTRVR